jgi:hypothetical protein
MTSSSKARPANRTAWFIILAALLLSLFVGSFADRSEVETGSPALAQSESQQVEAQQPVKVAAPTPARTYHAEETSQQAGAMGFWILFSLWAVLLSAGLAPRLLQALRRSSEHELASGRLTLR